MKEESFCDIGSSLLKKKNTRQHTDISIDNINPWKDYTYKKNMLIHFKMLLFML